MTATRRRGDRSRRSRDRAVKVVQKLERRIPYYDLFEEDGLALIEAHADRILAEVGIEIWGDEVTIELFRDAGATVDGQRLRFAPGLVTAGTDSRFLAEVAQDTYRFQPITLSMAETTMIHGVDERMTLENLDRMVRFYARLMATAAR